MEEKRTLEKKLESGGRIKIEGKNGGGGKKGNFKEKKKYLF